MILVKDINHPTAVNAVLLPTKSRDRLSWQEGKFRTIGLFVTLKYEMKYIYFSSFEKKN